MAIPRLGGRQRTRKYTILHDVLFVVSYIKLNCFTCVYLIINLYVSIFTGSPRRSMLTYALAGEMSDNHFGSHSGICSMHVSDEEDTVGVGGEVPHKRGTLNAYKFLSQLSIPLIYIDFKFTYS